MEDSDLLGKKALEPIKNTEKTIYWSATSYWELTFKISLGKIKMHRDCQSFIKEEKRINRIPRPSDHGRNTVNLI